MRDIKDIDYTFYTKIVECDYIIEVFQDNKT